MADTTQYTAEQIKAFKDAVALVLPTAIPIQVDKLSQFAIGSVLIYKEKPKTTISWRKYAFKFGRDDDGKAVKLYDLLSQEDSRRVSADRVRPVSNIYAKRTGEQWNYAIDEESDDMMKLAVDLGTVYELSSNLYSLLDTTEVKVDLEHPVVKKAVENGGVMMVVSTVFQSERACIELGKMEGEDKPIRWSPVYTSPSTTTLAYLMLKLRIGEHGTLKPLMSMGLTPKSLVKINVDVAMRVSQTTLPTVVRALQGLTLHKPTVETVVEEPRVEVDGGQDETDYADPSRHFECGLRDFDVFHSTTYAGMIEESREFVKALQKNEELQKAFLKLLTSPHQRTNLDKLAACLHSIEESLRLHQPEAPCTCPEAVKTVHQKFSANHNTRAEEVKALLIAAEAFREFPGSSMERIVTLPPEKREEILGLIKHIPSGSYHHVFTEPAYPDSDLVFYQILRKMGFGNSAGHLDFVGEDENIDMLGAGITAILASEKVQG